jgi:hypothetical protein
MGAESGLFQKRVTVGIFGRAAILHTDTADRAVIYADLAGHAFFAEKRRNAAFVGHHGHALLLAASMAGYPWAVGFG